MKKNTPVMTLILIFCVSCVAPTLSPTPAATSIPTPTTALTQSPTLTLTPIHTSTPTQTPTSTPTVTATPDPKIEAIRELVGDQPEDWFKWRDDWVGYEVRFIFPGVGAISDIPFELKDGEGVVVGKAFASFSAQYLIGDEIKEISIPFLWENSSSKFCINFAEYFLDSCEDILKDKEFVLELLTMDEILLNWTPGEVVILYINEPNREGLINDMEKGSYEDTDFFYNGKEDKLEKLLIQGDPGIGVLLINMHQYNCKGNEIKIPLVCRNDADTIIVPGYQ